MNETLKLLVILGYFRQMRYLLDNNINSDNVLNLVNRPLLKVNLMSPINTEIILYEFCSNFLCPNITQPIKNDLLPYLRTVNKFPYEELLRFLNDNKNIERNNNLLYCILALEPPLFGKSKILSTEQMSLILWFF